MISICLELLFTQILPRRLGFSVNRPGVGSRLSTAPEVAKGIIYVHLFPTCTKAEGLKKVCAEPCWAAAERVTQVSLL